MESTEQYLSTNADSLKLLALPRSSAGSMRRCSENFCIIVVLPAVRKAVSTSDWATLNKAIEKKGSIDRLFGPMQLWASSFSGKTISDKTVAMNAAVDELRDAVSSLT